MKSFLKNQTYRRARVRARIVPVVREFLSALMAGILIFIMILFFVAYSSPAHAFPFGKIQKSIRIASAAMDLAKKYRKKTQNEIYLPAATSTAPTSTAPTPCTTDADCCDKNPKICEATNE